MNAKEKQILEVLLMHDYLLSTTQTAKLAGISWNTADKYLHNLYDMRWIEKKERGSRDYWRARPPHIEPKIFKEIAILSRDARDQYFVRFPKVVADALHLENMNKIEFIVTVKHGSMPKLAVNLLAD